MICTTRLGVLLGVLGCVAMGCKVGDGADFDGSLFDDDAATGGRGKDAGGRITPDSGTDSGMAGPDASGPGEDAGDAGGAAEPSAVAKWPALHAQAICDALLDCLGKSELLVDTLGGRDCVNLYRNRLENSEASYLVDSVADGRVLYGPDQLQNCLDDIAKQGCAVVSSRLPASCGLAFAGTIALDADCAINEDCAGDAFCAKGAVATCPGVCAPLQAKGMLCTSNDDEQCEGGLVCSNNSCEPLGALGDACSTGNAKCRPGLACLDQGTSEKCVAIDVLYFKKLGETCEVGTALCQPGLVCESVSGTTGVCATTVDKGASCKRAQPNQCPAEQYCDAQGAGTTGMCLDRPGDGKACLAGRSQSCADGHLCIDTICRALAQVGEACIDDSQCYSKSCGADALCAAPLMCTLP